MEKNPSQEVPPEYNEIEDVFAETDGFIEYRVRVRVDDVEIVFFLDPSTQSTKILQRRNTGGRRDTTIAAGPYRDALRDARQRLNDFKFEHGSCRQRKEEHQGDLF